MLRKSQLPLEKSLDSFDTRRLPPKAARQMRTLLDGGFLERTENVLVFGNPGSGKTNLLQAVGQELIRKGRRILFISCEMLVQELLIANRDLKLSTAPGCCAKSRNSWLIAALFWLALGPSSHLISSALRPCIAAHVFSATTATPVEISCTLFTPGSLSSHVRHSRFTGISLFVATTPPHGRRIPTAAPSRLCEYNNPPRALSLPLSRNKE